MKTGTLFIVVLFFCACSGNGGGGDGGMDAADGFDAVDEDNSGDGDVNGDGDGSGGDDGGHEVIYDCPFPFGAPRKHTVTDEQGHAWDAWDVQVLCTVRYEDTDAEVLLYAEPTGMEYMNVLYEAREAWVCENEQVTRLAAGSFFYEAKGHGWDVMDVAFGGKRYHWGWSEICVGYRPCTSRMDIFDVFDPATGTQLASNQPTECVYLTENGNPRPLVPQVRVPADGDSRSFQMGSNLGESDETPVHGVTIKPVRMDVREATWADFALFINDYGNDCEGQPCINLSLDGVHLQMQGSLVRPEEGFEDHPVVQVGWQAAKTYCEWRSWMQLPTEAQWEMAASAAGEWDYPWGDNLPSCDLALYEDCGAAHPDPVCSRMEGNSREGVCDLAGNVAEWVSDWYGESFYSTCTLNCDNPTGPEDGTTRVVRGGSCSDAAYYIRAAERAFQNPAEPSSLTGVRCVRYTFPQNQ